MKLDFYLADSASIDDRSKTYALGLGWMHTASPTPPFSILIFADLLPEEVPTELDVHVALVDANDQPVHFPNEDGPPLTLLAHVVAPAPPENRDPILRVPLLFNIGPGMILQPGIYRFQATLSSTVSGAVLTAEQPFRIRQTGESPKPELPVLTELRGGTERSQIELVAASLGFLVSRNIATASGSYERPDRQIVVAYDGKTGNVRQLGYSPDSLEDATLEEVLAALKTPQVQNGGGSGSLTE